MPYIIISIVIAATSLILRIKYHIKYALPILLLSSATLLVSIFEYTRGDSLHVANISSKILLIIFTGVLWRQYKEKFWYQLMMLNIGWFLVSVYALYIENIIFQSVTSGLLISKTLIGLLYSLLLSILAWVTLPLAGTSKKLAIIIALLLFIFLGYLDLKVVWSLIL